MAQEPEALGGRLPVSVVPRTVALTPIDGPDNSPAPKRSLRTRPRTGVPFRLRRRRK